MRYPRDPEGTIRELCIKGAIYIYRKIGKKWVSQGRKFPPEKETRGRKPSGIPTKKQRIIAENKRLREIRNREKQEELLQKAIRKAQKQVYMVPKVKEKVIPTLVRDPAEYKSVRVNEKTTIQVKKNVPDKVAVSNYLQKLAEMEKLKYKPANSRKYGR